MAVTLTANYKETLKPETVTKIDELVDDNYALDDILEFIDEHNEDDFVSFYEEYVEQGEELGYDVVDAFIKENDICNVEHCRDAYRGSFDSEEAFVEEWIEDVVGIEIPTFIVVDYAETWRCSLCYDFDFVDGFIFDRNF